MFGQIWQPQFIPQLLIGIYLNYYFNWGIAVPPLVLINAILSSCPAAVNRLSCYSLPINQSVTRCQCLKHIVVFAICSSYIAGNWKLTDSSARPLDYGRIIYFSSYTWLLWLQLLKKWIGGAVCQNHSKLLVRMCSALKLVIHFELTQSKL